MSSSVGRKSDKSEEYLLKSTVDVGPSGVAQDPVLERLEAETLRAMTADWRSGTRMPAEKWLERQPQFCAQKEVAVRIIYEEVCLREELGEKVDSAEVYRRFPQFQDALEVLLDCHRLVRSDNPTAAFPEAGEHF